MKRKAPPKPRDPHWKMLRAMGHKIIPNAKRRDRKSETKVSPRNLDSDTNSL